VTAGDRDRRKLAMEYGPFGRTGLEVSAVGFGCQEIGGGYGSIEEAEFARAVSRALDLGINCFDTAEAYGFGASEQALGRALGRRRDEAIVVTKFGTGYPDQPNFRDSSPARVRSSIDKSLKNLGTDHVDVYLVHWPDRSTPFAETMGALDDLVRDGKARFVGVSNFTRDEIEACMQTRRVDIVQYGLNMFDRRMQRGILPYCEEQGIGFEAYGPLAYGLLSGTLAPDVEFPADDWRSKSDKWGVMAPLFNGLFRREVLPRNVAVAEELQRIAARSGRSLPQLALRWTSSNAGVSTSLVGCRSPAEVENNVGALGWTIDAADLAEIDEAFARHGVDTCLDAWIEEL
jgi:aryl-alcohol dehydrogenase-like predicted oxidoreductase